MKFFFAKIMCSFKKYYYINAYFLVNKLEIQPESGNLIEKFSDCPNYKNIVIMWQYFSPTLYEYMKIKYGGCFALKWRIFQCAYGKVIV